MKIEKQITMNTAVDVECRPMHWAVTTTLPPPTCADVVIAMFNSEADAGFFVKALPSQGLNVRRIISNEDVSYR